MEVGAAGFGFNCWLSPSAMLGLGRRARGRPQHPILARPPTAPGPIEVVSTAALAAGALELLAAGASAVGGCCGAGPTEIRAMRRAMDLEGSGAEPRLAPER
jgi:methionine synthase I (cobalamin-dependent)